jgi:ApbE superfamily uncharacterized protein (UPF0280 family)
LSLQHFKPDFRDGLYRIRRRIRQSSILILTDRLEAAKTALNTIALHRTLLEGYILRRPEYQYTLNPIKVEEDAPKIVRLAAEAAELVGVGPMAAIPGALAELAVEDMLLHHRSHVNLVENGGEIAAASNRQLTVGVYAGPSPISGKVGLQLQPEDFPIGIATSSASVSHALNFGEADAAVVIADSASMADAAAKAVCNAVKGEDKEASVQSGLEVAETIPQVRGAIVIRGKYIGTVGRLPKLVKLEGEAAEVLEAGLHTLAHMKGVNL